jgi:four helix bundle protein
MISEVKQVWRIGRRRDISDFGMRISNGGYKNTDMDTSDLKERTKKFALNVLALTEELPKTSSGFAVAKQLSRCGTSVGANYRSACRAKSKADFIAKIEIVEEEADECCYWLEIIIEGNMIKNAKPKKLLEEANELTAIFTATGKTVKERYSKFKK